jgi:hypothetical protein
MSAADIQRPASKLKFGGLTEYRGEEFPHSNSRTVQSRVKIECLFNSHSEESRVAALRHCKSPSRSDSRVFFHRYRMVRFNAVVGLRAIPRTFLFGRERAPWNERERSTFPKRGRFGALGNDLCAAAKSFFSMHAKAASPHAFHGSPARRREPVQGRLCIDTIRTLAMDAVQKANSGHAGTPMALAPVAYTLWQEFLRYDPLDPIWPNRDRFVLSAGHASMLLYALLHLSGVRRVDHGRVTDGLAVSLDDIRRFRQIDSVTPGHPERGLTTASRQRRVRWDRGAETASEWRWRRDGSRHATTGRISFCSTMTSMRSAAMAT